MTPEELKKRTKQFALRVMKLVDALPRQRTAETIGRQLIRSATSVGANYRAACRARSKSEFLAKLGIVEEEIDESIYWMELIVEGQLEKETRMRDLLREAEEINAIIVSSIRMARAGRTIRNPKSAIRN